jgi:hypothetical protein
MARLEIRKFKSKTQLLIILETGDEYQAVKSVLGLVEGTRVQAEVVHDPCVETYIRFTKPHK